MIKNKYIIIILVLIVMFGVAAFYFLSLLEIKKQADDILEIRKQIKIVEEKQQNIRSLEGLLADVDIERRKIENIFVGQKSVVLFIEELERLALLTNSSLIIQQITLPKDQKTGGPVFLINISGSFRDVFRYLALLENTAFQVSFESVDFIKQSNQKNESLWSLRIQLRLLSFIY